MAVMPAAIAGKEPPFVGNGGLLLQRFLLNSRCMPSLKMSDVVAHHSGAAHVFDGCKTAAEVHSDGSGQVIAVALTLGCMSG